VVQSNAFSQEPPDFLEFWISVVRDMDSATLLEFAIGIESLFPSNLSPTHCDSARSDERVWVEKKLRPPRPPPVRVGCPEADTVNTAIACMRRDQPVGRTQEGRRYLVESARNSPTRLLTMRD